MRAPWVVHEGYLLCKPQDISTATATTSAVSVPAATSTTHANGNATPQLLQHPFKNGLNHFHAPHLNGVMATASGKKLVERYVVIYMNRKMEMYEAAPSIKAGANSEAAGEKEHGGERGKQIGVPLYVSAFAGWDGDGLLKVGESYGLELKVDPKAHGSGRNTTSMHVAAFNRVDLEKWCRAIVAVLDPQSAAGEEVRREHRRVRKEEKRLEQERQDKIRKWREMKIKQAEEERERMLAREEEISNMTPLERVDGLGSLDDDTAEFLEKRKLRLQKRHAPTTGRVNKAAYRKRIEEAAGGKLENMQPLQPKIVETKIRVRVELPLPGQFIEAAGISNTHRIGLPNSKDRTRLGSSSSESSLENPSDTSSVSSNSLLSSGHSGSSSSQMKHASKTGFAPPPPPPPHALMMMQQNRDSSLRSSFVPPPPPPQSESGFVDTRLSRTGSFRGSLYDDEDDIHASL